MKHTATKHRRGLWRILLVLVLLVSSAVGILLMFPGRCYLFYERYRPTFRLALQREPTDAELTPVTFDALLSDSRVTLTNTLMLVNAAHPLPEDYTPSITEYKGIELHPQSVEAYRALSERVLQLTGDRLLVTDDYRTRKEQEEILAGSAAGIAAQVGCSEHEAGLALDVCVKGYGGQSFLKTWAGIYVNLFCHNYGYIIRYPAEKEAITGISYEPWHLRYVGKPHAELMHRSGLTLEEYVDSLTLGVWYSVGEYRICRTSAQGIRMPQGWKSCEISPDNTGYYIITLQMD